MAKKAPRKRQAKRKAAPSRRRISYEEERTILAQEQTILSKERTILSFMRTGLTFIVLGLGIVSVSELVGEALIAVQAVGWVIVVIGFAEVFESYRRLRRYQNKMKELEKEVGKDL